MLSPLYYCYGPMGQDPARTLGVGLTHFGTTGRMGKCRWCFQSWAGSVVWMLYSSPQPLKWAQLPMYTQCCSWGSCERPGLFVTAATPPPS